MCQKLILLAIVSLLMTTPLLVRAQEQANVIPRVKSEGASIGGILLKDTYLSPLNYGGIVIGYYNETNRLYSSLLGQKHFDLRVAKTDNPAGNANIYALQGRLQGSRQFRLYRGSFGNFYAGPGYNVGIGGLYSSRNGNNPATFHADANLSLNLSYSYRLAWRKCPILFLLESRTNLLGTYWGQGFGESYYEMSYLTNSLTKKFNFSHLGNTFAQELRLSVDIPLYSRVVLNLRGTMSLHRWEINQIKNRQDEYIVGLGFTNYVFSTGGKAWLQNNSYIPF